MKKKLLFILLIGVMLFVTGCKSEEKEKFKIKTDQISVYVGQNINLEEKLEYSKDNLKNVKVSIVEGKYDVTKAGKYTIKVKATADGKESEEKEITIETKEFASDEEVCNLANEIITNNKLQGLECTLETGNVINIGNISFGKTQEDTILSFSVKLKTGISVTAYTGTKQKLVGDDIIVLSRENYFIRMMVDITKKNVKLDTNNNFNAKSITIKSDTGTYEYGGRDSLVLPDWKRSSMRGTYQDPKYDMTSILGYNLYDLDKINNVLEGDNVVINVNLWNGLNKNSDRETTYTIELNEEELTKLREIVKFEKLFIYEYTNNEKM